MGGSSLPCRGQDAPQCALSQVWRAAMTFVNGRCVARRAGGRSVWLLPVDRGRVVAGDDLRRHSQGDTGPRPGRPGEIERWPVVVILESLENPVPDATAIHVDVGGEADVL